MFKMKWFVIISTFLVVNINLACADDQPSPDIEIIPDGISGAGTTTRYWDCCKPSCAWAVAIEAPTPVQTCEIDGVTIIDPDAGSGCGNGTADTLAYTCNTNQPWIVNDTLSYGFSAVSFAGGADTEMCCACLLLEFQGELLGKKMVVQYTNTGGDLGVNHFDLEMPGGGVGIFGQGCMNQWNAPEDGWGDRYGGVTSVEGCDDLPLVLQDGCRWRWDFMNGVSNPDVMFYQVKCPAELVAITGCELPTD